MIVHGISKSLSSTHMSSNLFLRLIFGSCEFTYTNVSHKLSSLKSLTGPTRPVTFRLKSFTTPFLPEIFYHNPLDLFLLFNIQTRYGE